MKKILILTLLMGMAVLPVAAQQEITSTGLLDFSKVEFSGNMAVTLIPSDSARIDIKLSEVEVNKLTWGIKDGLLSVRLKPGMKTKGKGEVVLHYKQVNTIKAAEANVAVEGIIQGLMLDVDLSAGAVLGATVETTDLYMKVGGNSAATLGGVTKYCTVLAGAKSKVDTRDLTAESVRVEASSGAEVYVSVIQRLQMSADLGASIFYKGSPEIIRSSAKCLGTINNIGQ